MRPLLCTLLIACQTPIVVEPPADSAPVSRPDPWDVTPKGPPAPPRAEVPKTIAMSPTAEPIVDPTPHRLVTAMPSGTITVLAITDDARAAVTADFSHSARIWPTLDGKREPVVVPLRQSTALALARDGNRLVIGALDPAGQLELVVTTASGELVRRVAVEATRPFIAIHAVPSGFLVLDDERNVFAVGVDGVPSAPLVADPEHHVVALAVRGDRALAMIDTEGKVHGRWIELDGLRWGAATPTLPFTGDRIALTPNGKRIAGVTTRGKRIVVIDLATGRQVYRAVHSELDDPQLRPVGFVDNETLAFTEQNQTVSWWHGEEQAHNGSSDGVLVAGNGVVVSALGTSLQVVTPHEPPEFLGYRMGGPQMLLPVGDRFLATDSTKLVEIDRHFKTRRVHELGGLPDSQRGWSAMRFVDAGHVLATTYIDSAYAIYLIDLAANEAKLVAGNGYPVDYQPASGLLLYRSNNAYEIVHIDQKTHAISKPTRIEYDPAQPPTPVLLDPEGAQGNQLAIIAQTNRTRASIKLIGALHPERAAAPYDITTERTVELTQRWWDTVGDLSKLVDPAMLPSPRLESPDGKHRAELRGAHVRLFDQAGRTVWVAPAHTATSLVWTASGRLIAFGAGIAELDIKSGALLERQCGWWFGRWNKNAEGFGPTNLCDAP
jgi:hypothetical protein